MSIITAPLTLKDWDWVKEFALEQTDESLPYLRPDPEKMKAIFTDAVSSAKNFTMGAWEDGEPVGAMITLTAPNLWAGKQCSSVLLWVSKVAPTGARMLKSYREWLENRAAIRVAGFSPNFDLPDRTLRLMQLCGFSRQGGSYLYTLRGI